jgi:beta-galactosidase/beta-glucuronidase
MAQVRTQVIKEILQLMTLVTALFRSNKVGNNVAELIMYRNDKVAAVVHPQDGETHHFTFSGPDLWSPDDPALYDIELRLGNDTIRSYMGFREVGKKDITGINGTMFHRPTLNGNFLFQMGVLDQGYWPDGLYTAPSEEAMRFDIETLKKAGFNMLRKHIKVEPSLFYRACDELGILVVQDMPCSQPDRLMTPNELTQFGRELEAIVQQLKGHPSIVTWVGLCILLADCANSDRPSSTKVGPRDPR